MISYHDEAIWKPVRLYDEASIAYLNELLADGWFIMEIGVDGLQFLAFNVPLVSSKHVGEMEQFLTHGPSGTEPATMTLVILTKGSEKNRQMALAAFRDESGYIDASGTKADRKFWRILVMMPLENGMVIIYKKKSQGD
jgi:hypothetical protein